MKFSLNKWMNSSKTNNPQSYVLKRRIHTCTFSAISLSSQPVSILFNWKLSVSSSLIRYSTVVRKSPRIDSSFNATTIFLGEATEKNYYSNKYFSVYQSFERIVLFFWRLSRKTEFQEHEDVAVSWLIHTHTHKYIHLYTHIHINILTVKLKNLMTMSCSQLHCEALSENSVPKKHFILFWQIQTFIYKLSDT